MKEKICLSVEKEDPECELNLDVEACDIATIPVPYPIEYSHDALRDRELPNQHPIDAITGLKQKLDSKVDKKAGEGLMTDAERAKLAGIETGAQVNKIEVIKVNGELIPVKDKTVDIIKDFAGELTFDPTTRELTLLTDDGTVLSTVTIPGKLYVGDEITIHVNDDTISIHPDIISEIEATETGLANHIIAQDNPHKVTKAQVGLGNVDDTSDADKPISTAQQTALDAKLNKDFTADVLTGADVVGDAVQVKMTVDKINPSNGVVGQFEKTFPVADASKMGMMAPEQVSQINANTADIEALKGRTIRYMITLAGATSQDLLTAAYLNRTPKPPVPPLDGTTLVNTVDNKEFTWFTSEGKWVDRGVTVVSLATNDSPGIVQGSLDKFKVQTEGDGTMSVNGLDALENTVNNSKQNITDHVADKNNPHEVTKTQVGLGNVDNTSDAQKPVSTATQEALDTKASTASLSALEGVVDAHKQAQDNPHKVTAAQVGLGNVDNTSDKDKPVSDATQLALDGKQPTGDYATKTELSDGLAKKLNIAQSTVDAGKFMQVGVDGNLVPADIPAPEEVKWGNLKGNLADQTDLNDALAGKATTGAVQAAQADATQALVDAKKANDALPNKADTSYVDEQVATKIGADALVPINSAIEAVEQKNVEQDTAIGNKADTATVTANFGKTVTDVGVKNGADRPRITKVKGDNGVVVDVQFPIVGEGSQNIAGAVTKAMWDAKADKTQLSDYVPRNIAEKVEVSTAVEATEAAVTLVTGYTTLADGSTSEIRTPLPLANGQNAGLILSSDYETIAQNKSDIEALKGRALRYPVNIEKEKPTSAELSKIYGEIVPTPPIPAIDGTTLVDLTHSKEYTWYTAKDGWIDRGFTTVSPATNTSLGLVKGTADVAGKIFVETDGTMSMKGYDALKSATDNNDAAIKAHVAVKSGNPHNVTATDVGLGNVDNTSDANKPISDATQGALNTLTENVGTAQSTADAAVKKAGDTMTGKLIVGEASMDTNGYIEGTWFKTNSITKLASVPDKICVVDPSGWVYYNDKAQLKEALGVNGKQDAGDYAFKSDLTGKLDKLGGQAEYGMAKGARQVRNVILETADPSSSDCQNGDVWANYGDTPDIVVKMHDAWTKVADVTTVAQDANGVTINGNVLQDASDSQDGLMTKEMVARIVALENIPNANGRLY